MFRVSVMYLRSDSSYFDLDYYENNHMPMVKSYIGKECKAVQIEMPLNEEQPYHVLAHLLFESLESFQKSYMPHSVAIKEDVKNYTNIVPLVQMGIVTDI